MPYSLFYTLLFVFGTTIGSFLNVATLRYQPEGRLFSLADLRGRSRCPSCGTTLRWFELIPLLSFLALRGRCRSCGARISLQYPLIELLSGCAVGLAPLFFNRFWGVSDQLFFSLGAPLTHYLLIALWVAAVLLYLVLVVIDVRHFIIPNGVSLAIAILGLAVTANLAWYADTLPVFRSSFLSHYQLLFTPFQSVLLNHLLGVAVGGALFGLLHFLSRGRAMGFGDVKLAAASGLVLGWPDIGLAIALSFIVGGLWGSVLIVLGTRTLRDLVPFGPFFVVGVLGTVFLGAKIIGWYFGLFRV
ncbi:MAG: prepilin peptidase [Patescibacteria group bacterium]